MCTIVELDSAAAVDDALRKIAQARRDEEVRLRVLTSIRPVRIALEVADAARIDETLREAHARLDEEINKLGGSEQIESIVRRASDQVEKILQDGRELEAFHGKKILRSFLDQFCRDLAMSTRVFAYEMAQRAQGTNRLQRLIAQPVAKIRHYVPADLVPALEAACQALPEGQQRADADGELRAAGAARARWEQGQLGDRREQESLRAATFRVAHAAREHGLDELNRALVSAAVEIGTT